MSNPNVDAKNRALANVVPLDVQQLQVENAAIAQELAIAPSRPDAGTLNARKAAIATTTAHHTNHNNPFVLD